MDQRAELLRRAAFTAHAELATGLLPSIQTGQIWRGELAGELRTCQLRVQEVVALIGDDAAGLAQMMTRATDAIRGDTDSVRAVQLLSEVATRLADIADVQALHITASDQGTS